MFYILLSLQGDDFSLKTELLEGKKIAMGPMLLFTGYRSPDCDLFVEEKSAMVAKGILDYAFLALSRHSAVPKVLKFPLHQLL